MNKIKKYSLAMAAFGLAGIMGACGEFKPETPDLPNLPTVSNLQATVANRVVTLNWQLPTSSLSIEGVTVKVNNNQEVTLEGNPTTYTVMGQPMEDEYMYTVKVNYKGGYVSEGQSVIATVPYEELADLTSFKVTGLEKKNVTFSWTLPNASGITGVWVGLDGSDSGTVFPISDYPTGGTLGGQKTGVDLKFRAKVVYDEYYQSQGVVVNTALPEMETRVGFLVVADSPEALENIDDDEFAAALWFSDNYVDTDKGDFIMVSDLPSMTEEEMEEYGVIWIMIDRMGLAVGWENLPAQLVSESTIKALQAYGAMGGAFYLSNMAAQLSVPLGLVPENMPINTFSSNSGGEGGDVWVINPYLGWDFRPGGDRDGEQDFYDRTAHAIYAGLTLEDPNGYGYSNLPLIGPGWREDHNCLWDINGMPAYDEAGKPGPNQVKWFENQTNSLVLATWGHVRDHCVAGLVDFEPNAVHGRSIVNGYAAYEWNQNSGENPYQENIEKLTENILNYLK